MKLKKVTLTLIGCTLFLLFGTAGCIYQCRAKLESDIETINDKLQKKYHPQTWQESQFAAQPYV